MFEHVLISSSLPLFRRISNTISCMVANIPDTMHTIRYGSKTLQYIEPYLLIFCVVSYATFVVSYDTTTYETQYRALCTKDI